MRRLDGNNPMSIETEPDFKETQTTEREVDNGLHEMTRVRLYNEYVAEKPTKNVTGQVSEELYAHMNALRKAGSDDKTMSTFVREILANHVAHHMAVGELYVESPN